MKYTYLLINLCAVAVPLLFSFHPRLRFDRHWKAALPAIAIPGVLFVIWDVLFTSMGVWWFNEDYVTGIHCFGLPVEEWLFFICIPYACLFTYHCLGILLPQQLLRYSPRVVSAVLIVALLSIALSNTGLWYTSVTFFSLALTIALCQRILRAKWLPQFYSSYLALLLPFFIVNGLLTGTGLTEPVVLYNDSENLGIRLLTIPVEDLFYGMLLILMNVIVFERLRYPARDRSGK